MNSNIPEKFTCCDCSRRIQVGDWVEQKWYCVWCVKEHKKPKPYEAPPPYTVPVDFMPSEKKGYKYMRAKMQTKIEEIPCDGELEYDTKTTPFKKGNDHE